MGGVLVEIVFVCLLIFLNGLFAMSELAVVSARKARLKQRAESGDRGALAALELADDPNRFLSTVQIGITVVGTLAGVFGGATIAEKLADRIETIPQLQEYGETIALTVVVAGIAYLSLIFGELVPKRLALTNPEKIAGLVAPPLRSFAKLGVPLVKLLSGSTDLVLRLLRIKGDLGPAVTEEEIQVLIREGAQAGVIEQAEHEIVRSVFRLDDRPTRVAMTRRNAIRWIDATAPPEAIREQITRGPQHTRLPVCDGDLGIPRGYVHVQDLLRQLSLDQPLDLESATRKPLFVYEATPLLKVLETFKISKAHFALVIDEFGAVVGLLTLNDLMESIVGDLPEHDEDPEIRAVRREDGSWLLDGTLAIDEVRELLGAPELPDGDYDTLAGLVITQFGQIPKPAQSFTWRDFRFEVVDMDGRRVDRVLIHPPSPPDADPAPENPT